MSLKINEAMCMYCVGSSKEDIIKLVRGHFSEVNISIKKQGLLGLASSEAEIRRIEVPGQPGKKVHGTPMSMEKRLGSGNACLASPGMLGSTD
jgi:hypothetical protein